MKKLIKNKKLLFGIIIGLIIGTSITGVIAYSVYANKVTYDNTQSGSQSTEVHGAIDELYQKANQNITYKDLQCPGCVYRKSATKKYNVNSSSSKKTDENSKLISSEYTTDYRTLNSNNFLGHVIDSNGYILSSYTCGINNGTLFCLRGVDSNQYSLTYKPFYQENVNRLNKVFPGCNATTSSSSASCFGDVYANVDSEGGVLVSGDYFDCPIYKSSESSCVVL